METALRTLRNSILLAPLLLVSCAKSPEPSNGSASAPSDVAAQAQLVEAEIHEYFKQTPPRKDYGSWRRRGDALRPLIPELLKSSDIHVVHEALLLARSRFDAPEVVPYVIATLARLLEDPRREEGGTRRLACDVLGKYGDRKAIPVLLRALDDPYLDIDFTAGPHGGAAEMSWFAVWRDADRALRAITGANPVEQPRQREPVDGQRQAVRDAWQRWWREQGESGDSRE